MGTVTTTAYKAAVEACMAEVGQPAPEWISGAAHEPDGTNNRWWADLERAIDLCSHLWTDDDFDDPDDLEFP